MTLEVGSRWLASMAVVRSVTKRKYSMGSKIGKKKWNAKGEKCEDGRDTVSLSLGSIDL
jgi:hypothetical protein